MHGPLSEIGLAEVMQLLERGGRTGLLVVTGPEPDDRREIAIRRGAVVDVGPITRADLLLHLARRSLVPPGSVAAPDELLEAARHELASRSLLDMLAWNRGRFDFSAREDVAGSLRMQPASMVMQLVAAESARSEMAAATDEFSAVPQFRDSGSIADGGFVDLDGIDWRLLDRIDGARDLRTIAGEIDEPLELVAERAMRLAGDAIIQLASPVGDLLADARAALECGDAAAAAALLAERVAAAPDDAAAWRLLGFAEVRMGRMDRAAAAWTAWVRAAPGNRQEAAPLLAAAETMMNALRGAGD